PETVGHGPVLPYPLRNPPRQRKFHIEPDHYRNSLPVYPEGQNLPSLFFAAPIPVLSVLLHSPVPQSRLFAQSILPLSGFLPDIRPRSHRQPYPPHPSPHCYPIWSSFALQTVVLLP